MRREFIQVDLETDPRAAFELMVMARVRALPVLEAGRSVGWVHFTDLVRAALDGVLAGHPRSLARWLRPGEPIACEAPLAEAARRMLEGSMPCLLAAEPGDASERVVGLITETDLLRDAYIFPARS